MPEVPFLQVRNERNEWRNSNDLPKKIIKQPPITSLAIAERRVDRRSSQEFLLATRAVPGLRSEKTMMQLQPSVKRQLPCVAGSRGLAGSSVLQVGVVHMGTSDKAYSFFRISIRMSTIEGIYTYG